jgi:hypothetical protein
MASLGLLVAPTIVQLFKPFEKSPLVIPAKAEIPVPIKNNNNLLFIDNNIISTSKVVINYS